MQQNYVRAPAINRPDARLSGNSHSLSRFGVRYVCSAPTANLLWWTRFITGNMSVNVDLWWQSDECPARWARRRIPQISTLFSRASDFHFMCDALSTHLGLNKCCFGNGEKMLLSLFFFSLGGIYFGFVCQCHKSCFGVGAEHCFWVFSSTKFIKLWNEQRSKNKSIFTSRATALAGKVA